MANAGLSTFLQTVLSVPSQERQVREREISPGVGPSYLLRLRWARSPPEEVLVKVNIYVSREGPFRRQPGIALVLDPLRIPENGTWTYLRSGDTSEFDLPEAIEEEIERRGIWAQRIENHEIRQKR